MNWPILLWWHLSNCPPANLMAQNVTCSWSTLLCEKWGPVHPSVLMHWATATFMNHFILLNENLLVPGNKWNSIWKKKPRAVSFQRSDMMQRCAVCGRKARQQCPTRALWKVPPLQLWSLCSCRHFYNLRTSAAQSAWIVSVLMSTVAAAVLFKKTPGGCHCLTFPTRMSPTPPPTHTCPWCDERKILLIWYLFQGEEFCRILK